MPFGWWTRVGRRKHKFNRIRQVAPTCPHGGHIGATWRIRLNRLFVAAIRPYVKLLWPLECAVWRLACICLLSVAGGNQLSECWTLLACQSDWQTLHFYQLLGEPFVASASLIPPSLDLFYIAGLMPAWSSVCKPSIWKQHESDRYFVVFFVEK